jgi:copper chaperone CopZ
MKELGNQPVSVIAIWQPMLPTDWSAPARRVLARMRDPRVRQYWDPNHLLAKRMGVDARAPQPEPDCCVRNNILWDLAAIYRRDAEWTDRMPTAVFVNGPVVAIAEDLSSTVKALLGSAGSSRPEPPRAAPNITHATAAFRVSGMTCSGCADTLRAAAKRIAGLASIEVDHEKGTAWVRYDASTTSPRKIAEQLTRRSGMTTEVAPLDR